MVNGAAGRVWGAELPGRVRAWAEGQLATAIVEVVPLGGGMTNTKWLLHPADGDPWVLRWADPQTWGETGREHVRRESLACRLLADSGIAVPQLVACDVDGTSAGGPASLMTWLAGRVRLEPIGSSAITAVARQAVAVHRQRVPSDARPPVFGFRGPVRPEVPDWARYPALWRQAITLCSVGTPPTPYGLLHRDFHFGNILWQGERVSGLVDWAEVSWGPPDLDVAHLCSDFAMLHTVEDAEIFRAEYLRQGGLLDPDPVAARFWMISDILGFLPDPAHILAAVGGARPDLSADDIRWGLEDLLAATVL